MCRLSECVSWNHHLGSERRREREKDTAMSRQRCEIARLVIRVERDSKGTRLIHRRPPKGRGEMVRIDKTGKRERWGAAS